jgi:hypothetical protein
VCRQNEQKLANDREMLDRSARQIRDAAVDELGLALLKRFPSHELLNRLRFGLRRRIREGA